MNSGIKIKLDENLGSRGKALFRDAGFDVATVYQQGLTSTFDQTLFDVCRGEGRCLVTLDLDFSNPFFFDPAESAGVAVIRLPDRPSADDLMQGLQTLITGLGKSGIQGKLWVVRGRRIREYVPDEDNS